MKRCFAFIAVLILTLGTAVFVNAETVKTNVEELKQQVSELESQANELEQQGKTAERDAKLREAEALKDRISSMEQADKEIAKQIDTARAAYNALTEDQQDLVGNIKTLKEAEATYAHLEENYNAAKAVDDLIDAIGEVVYTEESKGKIDVAREAFDALNDEQQPLVSKDSKNVTS